MKRYKISATLPLPPTSNNIYVSHGRRRIKTTEARSWQNKAVKEILRQSDLGIQDEFDPDRMYRLDLHFFFAAVVNKGWDERWIDLGNRLKLLEDTVKIAVGVDDCATFVLHLVKDCDPTNPRVDVQMFSMPEDRP